MRRLKIAGAALNQTPIDWANNISNIKEAIGLAKANNVDILCLPELCITGYGCEDLFLSDWLPEKSIEKLLNEVVPYCKGIAVCVGLPMKVTGQVYNSVCLINDGEILGFTAKQFLPNEGVHYERRWFAPWPHSIVEQIDIMGNKFDFGDVTYNIRGINLAFEICEDAWQPIKNRPGIRHCKKLNKLDLILNPSASHFAFAKSEFRLNEIVLKGSKEFNCTYLYANLLGNEAGRMVYDGDIMIAQNGQLIKRNDCLSFKNIVLVTSEIDFDDPFKSEKSSIEIEKKEKEYEFRNALSLALFDYLRKSRSQGFVLSLSGGADSTTCAVMVSEMVKRGVEELGVKQFIEKLGIQSLNSLIWTDPEVLKKITSAILHCAYQSTKNSSEDTLISAKTLADEIGASFYHWGIDEEVTSYSNKISEALNIELGWSKYDIALQNIQARARSPIIWMLANIKHCLLITTSNRSEGDVGYATMDGDTSGSIAPIAAVDKHFIQQWLIWAEKMLGYKSLKFVNNLQPSAELRPLENAQTDESDLMPYFILVEIERMAIRDRLSPKETFEALKIKNLEENELLKQHIIKFYTMWCRNQWKRERIALSFHLDEFNVDPRTWCRFPILSGNYKEELEELVKIQ
ncbi:MAG TPA: nitrilase-related carbon-nitrogen hydrolase [Cytophagales bacterium]|nr:nitrilase-related carbon-nitrogen hydrolase [Cytophagales bacterium]